MPGPVLSERDLAVLRSFARRIDPSDAGAHNNLGVLYYQKGLIEDAIAEFVRALELDPRMQVAQSNLDIAYRDSGHYDRRITDLQDRVRRHPEDRDARWELGRAHAALGRHAEAIAEFQALIAWRATDVPAMLQLGLAEKARGNLDAATEWLGRACAQDPASAVARFYHGEVLYNRGLNEPALEACATPSPGTRNTPRRTTCSRSCTGTWVATRRRARPPSTPSS
jgi:FOG: TPR repeat